MSKLEKTHKELSQYIWSKYPNDEQLEIRLSMFDAYEFLTGNVDRKENRIRKHKNELYNKLMEEDDRTDDKQT